MRTISRRKLASNPAGWIQEQVIEISKWTATASTSRRVLRHFLFTEAHPYSATWTSGTCPADNKRACAAFRRRARLRLASLIDIDSDEPPD